MKATQKGTAAVAPESGYSRPRMVDAEGLSVSVRTEDGDTKVFDFRSVGAPPDLVGPLVAAFAKVSGPAGTWRQMTTVYNGWKALRRFLRFVGARVPECDHDHGPDRGCVEALALEHRYGFRQE